MPNGKTHKRINLLFLFILVICSIYYKTIINNYWIFIGFFFGTIWLTPDLDMEGTKPDKAWWKLEKIWNVYARGMKHRGWSHATFGTLTRLGYLFIIFVFPVIVYKSSYLNTTHGTIIISYKLIFKYLIIIWNFITQYSVSQFIIGLFMSDWLHVIADTTKTLFYKIFKRKKHESI